MKKGISWCAFPREFSDSRKFQMAKAAGFEGVEVPTVTRAAELENYRKHADRVGIEIISMLENDLWKMPMSSTDPEVRKAISAKIADNIRFAEANGIDTILCVPGVICADSHYPDAYANALRGFRELAAVAERHGVTLAIENVWNKFLITPVEFRGFIDSVASPNVKAYFDCGNICLFGFPPDWIRILGKDRIAKVHVKGFSDYPNVIGFPKTLLSDVPWKETIQALRGIAYDGYLTVEIKADGENSEKMIHQYSDELDQIQATR